MARLGVPDVDRAGRLARLTAGISATLPSARHSPEGAAFERLPPRALEHQTLDSVTFIFRPARPSLRALDVP